MIDQSEMLFDTRSFTRSNGTVMARLYERLTKASRRRTKPWTNGDFDTRSPGAERAYRRGVHDAFKALQAELV